MELWLWCNHSHNLWYIEQCTRFHRGKQASVALNKLDLLCFREELGVAHSLSKTIVSWLTWWNKKIKKKDSHALFQACLGILNLTFFSRTEGVFTPSMLEQIIWTLVTVFHKFALLGQAGTMPVELGWHRALRDWEWLSLFTSKTTAVWFVESVRRSLGEIIPTYKGLGV